MRGLGGRGGGAKLCGGWYPKLCRGCYQWSRVAHTKYELCRTDLAQMCGGAVKEARPCCVCKCMCTHCSSFCGQVVRWLSWELPWGLPI